MSYGLALSSAERFAGLAALSTWLPHELAGNLTLKPQTRFLQTLVQHGTKDTMIEISRARDSVERLRELQIPVTYREYDMGHEISPKSLADLSAWLEKTVLST